MSSKGPSAPPRGKLGRYEILAKIADGGMAAVYVARRDDGEIVAIKRIREDFARNKEFRTMLLDEAKIVSFLRHSNIVRYYELNSEEKQAFLSMELLLGQSLWSVWEACRSRGVRLRYDMIAWIGARVADGLHYAHQLTDTEGKPLGIVHRDVNATNIFVTYDGEVKVIDFGLAKAANRASKTAAGVIKGKVAYMSPEQSMGTHVDARTDIFALGATLWELACDRRLFKRTDEMETLKRVHAAEVPDATMLVDGFPPELWKTLKRALARRPEDRHASAADMARELDTFAGPSVDAKTITDVMRELFAEDRTRQLAWIADASGPGASRKLPPLKARSPFWAGDGLPPSIAGQPVPPALAPAAVSPSISREAPPVTARLVPILLVIALVVAATVGVALAVR